MSGKDQKMTCRQVAELTTDLLEGVLASTHQTSVERHLDGCPNCCRFVEQIQLTTQLASAIRFPDRSSGMVERLTSALGASGRACTEVDTHKAGQYLADDLIADEQIAVAVHLLQGCQSCSSRCRSLAFPELEGIVETRLDLRERTTCSSEERAYQGLSAELEASEWDSSKATGVDLTHYAGWLVRRSRNEVTNNPQEASRLARLAWEVAQGLESEDRACVAMLRGHVSRKIDADYPNARRWFDLAERLLRCGSTGRRAQILLAQIDRMRGLALHCQSRSAEAMNYFESAGSAYVRLGELERFGECLMDQAQVVADLESPAAAIGLAYRASSLIRRSGQPRNALAFAQNLAGYQARKGCWDRGLSALRLAYEELDRISDSLVDRVQLDWTCGRILNAAGRYSEAAKVLESARREFIGLGLASKTAWISLELAVSLVETRELQRLREVSEPMIAYFASRQLPAETILAIRLFQEALVTQSIEAAQIRQLSRSLEASSSL